MESGPFVFDSAKLPAVDSCGGIRIVPEKPGYEEVVIAPETPVGLDWVDATLETVRGCIWVRWERKENGEIALQIQTPAAIARKIYQPKFCNLGPGVWHKSSLYVHSRVAGRGRDVSLAKLETSPHAKA